jgi:hypothetical protein
LKLKTKIEQLCTLLARREKRKEKKETWMITHTQSTWCEHYPLVGTQHTSTTFFIKKFKKQHENIKTPLIIHVNQCESKKRKKISKYKHYFLSFPITNKNYIQFAWIAFIQFPFYFLIQNNKSSYHESDENSKKYIYMLISAV